MKLNFNIPVLNMNGVAVLEAEKEVTLGTLLVAALLAPDNSKEAKEAEKLKFYDLAKRISEAQESDVTIDMDEASILLSVTSKTYPSPLIVGRLNDEIRKA
jgi:hypothetical protein